MFVYLLSLPVWNFVLPTYAFWKFDDFSWGDTRKTSGETTKKAGLEYEGEFDSSKITMRRWHDFEAGKVHNVPLKMPVTNIGCQQSGDLRHPVVGGHRRRRRLGDGRSSSKDTSRTMTTDFCLAASFRKGSRPVVCAAS